MRRTENRRIELLQLRTQLVRLRRFQVRRQRCPVRDAGRTQRQHGRDLVGRGIQLPHQSPKIGDPPRLLGFVGGVVREGCGRVGDEGEIVEDVLDLGDESVVGLLGEAAAEGGFPRCEGGVLFQSREEDEFLGVDGGLGFLKFVAGGGLLGDVAFVATQAGGDGRVDKGIEVCEQVEGGAEVAAELGAFGDGVGDECPDEGDGHAAGDAGEAVRGEEVDRVEGLAVACGLLETHFADLELVSDDQHLADSQDDPNDGQSRDFDDQVELEEGEEKQKHNDPWCLAVHNVPHHEARYHCKDLKHISTFEQSKRKGRTSKRTCPCRATQKPKDATPCSQCHPYESERVSDASSTCFID